jgi:uncharacterized protein YndB with AHSA1/START domain
LLDEWLMKSDFQPVVGHKFNFRSTPYPPWDGVIDGEVLTVSPNERLAYKWEALGLKSVVTWTLTPAEGATHLRMEQAGFGPENPYAYDGAQSGWGRFLDKLDSLLAAQA